MRDTRKQELVSDRWVKHATREPGQAETLHEQAMSVARKIASGEWTAEAGSTAIVRLAGEHTDKVTTALLRRFKVI